MGTRQPPKRRQQKPSIETLKSKHHGSRSFINGIYEFPMSYSVETNTGVGIVCNNICQDNVCFTQIPDYPNQLCYDGKMYAVCYGFPILTDYTVMADRTWFDKTGVRCFCSKYKDSTVAGLFRFEWVAGNKEYTSSLGKDTNVVFVDSNITWQTKTSYNGKALTNLQYEDGEYLIIGNRYEGDYSTYIGCHGKIIIADRSFTEEEINWLKDNWKKYEKVTVDISCIAGNRLCSGLVSPARAFAGRNTYRDKDTDGCQD